jgi:hypothetical protein
LDYRLEHVRDYPAQPAEAEGRGSVMILRFGAGNWYIDVRTADSSDQISFDLAHHLPRRLSAGQIIIVADNPQVFLSVIRKRWMKILRDVETQRSSTIDRLKRTGLQYEVEQMRNCKVSAKAPQVTPDARIHCITPLQLREVLPAYQTLYIVATLNRELLEMALSSLQPNGLIILYGRWSAAYEIMVRSDHNR